MSFPGTVVNGSIVLDGAPRLPEGSRVDVSFLDEDDELDAELAAMPIPPETETHEEFLESLRQSLADVKAGRNLGRPVDEVFADIARELNLPKVPRE